MMWTLEMIRELAEETGDRLATIYIPTHRAGPQIQQDPIRLKNAIRALEREAGERELDDERFEQLLAHPQALVDDLEFWRYQSHGLALFCRPDSMRILKLPFAPPELTRLGERFHVAPLIRGAGDGPVFHLLAVNRDGSVLYDVAGDEIAERPIEPMLESLEAARGMSDFDADRGFHTDHRGGPRTGGADGTPRYHALGTGTDEQEEIELERYLHSVATAVDAALADSTAPLVLAGGDRVTGRIRGMLKARGLCEGRVARNAGSTSAGALAEEARAIAAAETASPRSDAYERLAARLASGEATASADPEKLTAAAREGRIEVAFLDLEAASEGTLPDGDRARLVDEIAVETLRHGGTVYAMPREAPAELTPAAALFRY